jgi:hypothetical protein
MQNRECKLQNDTRWSYRTAWNEPDRSNPSERTARRTAHRFAFCILGFAFFIVLCLPVRSARSEVGDVTLRTNHPHYPGEGAFQTIDDCVKFATIGKTTPQEQAIALYHWMLTHQFHLYSPQEWNVPGSIPGTNRDDYEMVVYDANRSRFSYGYGLCGTVHAWNEPYWRALGMKSRRRAFPGHVNSEIEYGGSWHAFDTDMAGLLFRPDGVVAGYDDLKQDPSLVRLNDQGIVCYPFAWPGDFETMKRGWQEVAKGNKWYSMYNGGYAALPGVVRLRRGETFTRYFDRDHFGGPTKRRFWHVQKDGPFRNWTFVNMGPPAQHGEKSNCRGNASYANAVFHYEPDLNSGGWREGTVEFAPTREEATSGQSLIHESSVTFQHFSPYVICGDPVDDENPMSGRATDGLIVRGEAAGQISAEISVDQGQSWRPIGELQGSFQTDITDLAKGHYGWWIRLKLSPDSKLSRLVFDTTCQVNQAIYPRLTPNGCRVIYATKLRGVTVVEPNFGLVEQLATRNEVRTRRSENLTYSPRQAKQPAAYTTTDNKPAEIVYRIAAPAPLVEINAAARYRVRSPQPDGCDFRLDYSLDEGQTWSKLATAVNATDNEYSSGWVYGRMAVDTAATTALVRVHLDGGGYPTGLIHFEGYGVHRTPPPQGVEVTWAWRPTKSNDVQTHTEKIPAGLADHAWTVPTPKELTDAWVEIKAP